LKIKIYIFFPASHHYTRFEGHGPTSKEDSTELLNVTVFSTEIEKGSSISMTCTYLRARTD
jgi:hypothetical protein